MRRSEIILFDLGGLAVKIDWSWAILAVLIAWTLAEGLFPSLYAGLPALTYWWMGIAGVGGLFLSILLHELSHSIVARYYKVPIRGITLFIFGGVAELDGEPHSPRIELPHGNRRADRQPRPGWPLLPRFSNCPGLHGRTLSSA